MIRAVALLLLLVGIVSATYDAASISGEWLIDGYKAVLSPLQGGNICNFWPTCSQFTRAAISSEGFLPGIIIAADRLMRCNTFALSYFDKHYRGTLHDRLSDPVENHVAWRNPPAASAPAAISTPPVSGSIAANGNDPGLSFADHLYETGDYSQSAAEYLRVRFTTSLVPVRRYAGLMAGEAFLQARAFREARRAFVDADTADYSRYGAGRTLFAQAQYSAARQLLDSITAAPLIRPAAAVSGWSLFKEHDFIDGARVFARFPDDTTFSVLARFDGYDIHRRSRLVSSVLSVALPGAGQVYSGRAGDGVYSFLTVAGTGLITYWFAADPGHRDRTRVKVSVFGALTALFYAGNVYGANVAARDYNLLQERRYLEHAERLLGRLRLEPDYRILLDSTGTGTGQ